jgi:hypothetical protein
VCDDEVRTLAQEIWGDLDGVSRTVRACGRGTVIWGWPLDRVMEMQKIAKDFESTRRLDTELAWLHRRAGETDIYFVANLGDTAQSLEARFRVTGREAEIWRADTGAIAAAGFAIAGGHTTVPLELDGHESVLVVFRRAAKVESRDAPRRTLETLASIDGVWEASFPADLGAPDQATFAKLASWTASEDEGVRYFSGTATYAKTVQAPATWFRDGTRLWLDLGKVGDIAEVSMNGHALGIIWKPPYRVDATDVLLAGTNTIEIKVTNQWTNRLIGDRAVPEDRRVLNSTVAPGGFGGGRGAGANLPLTPSGLIGPVTVLGEARR